MLEGDLSTGLQSPDGEFCSSGVSFGRLLTSGISLGFELSVERI